jgi:glycosyl transferase family 1
MAPIGQQVVAPEGKARVCLASMRGTKKLAAWCSNYEFEDVIVDVDDVDLVTLSPGHAYGPREWVVNRLVWRRGVRGLAAKMNPGLQVRSLDNDYELFAFVCMHPSDLLYLNSLKGWKDRSKTKVCYIVEFYAGWLEEYAYHLGMLADFDHVMLCFAGSVQAVHGLIGRPVHHVALGVDALRFTPFPDPPSRVVDFYSMGRRSDPIHRALLNLAARREAFYVYDTIPGMLIQPADYRQHRDLLANFAKRSRFFMAYPAKVEDDESRGQSEVGARFFEGAAAGAVILGRAPKAPNFAEVFHWPDAVVDAGSSEEELTAALAKFKADPTLIATASRKSAAEALRKFDWAHRWKDILRLAGVEPTPKLLQRERHMHELAAAGEAAPENVA